MPNLSNTSNTIFQPHRLLTTVIGIVAIFSSQACSSDSTDDDFAGRWTFEDGSNVEIICPGQDPIVNSIANTGIEVEVIELEAGRLEITNSVPCTYEYRVDGPIAILDPAPQQCTVPDGQGGSTTETRTSETITLGGGMLSMQTSGYLGDPGGCTVEVSGLLTR